MPDFLYRDHDSFVLITPLTERGKKKLWREAEGPLTILTNGAYRFDVETALTLRHLFTIAGYRTRSSYVS